MSSDDRIFIAPYNSEFTDDNNYLNLYNINMAIDVATVPNSAIILNNLYSSNLDTYGAQNLLIGSSASSITVGNSGITQPILMNSIIKAPGYQLTTSTPNLLVADGTSIDKYTFVNKGVGSQIFMTDLQPSQINSFRTILGSNTVKVTQSTDTLSLAGTTITSFNPGLLNVSLSNFNYTITPKYTYTLTFGGSIAASSTAIRYLGASESRTTTASTSLTSANTLPVPITSVIISALVARSGTPAGSVFISTNGIIAPTVESFSMASGVIYTPFTFTTPISVSIPSGTSNTEISVGIRHTTGIASNYLVTLLLRST